MIAWSDVPRIPICSSCLHRYFHAFRASGCRNIGQGGRNEGGFGILVLIGVEWLLFPSANLR